MLGVLASLRQWLDFSFYELLIEMRFGKILRFFNSYEFVIELKGKIILQKLKMMNLSKTLLDKLIINYQFKK